MQAGVPGVVALSVGPGGSRHWAAGSGLTIAHRFPIASVTKTFVATVVLQLAGEGAIELDEPAPGLDATVRQLLNHTSGLPEAYGIEELIAGSARGRVPREVAEVALAKPRLFAPGEGWSYSGANYVFLGLLIEDVAASTLQDQLALRIFEPLGLIETELPDEAPRDLARGYLPADNPVFPQPGPGLVDVTDVLPGFYAGGGMVSTAPEVARFLRALLAGELLPATLRTELLRTVVSDWDESEAYGLGIEEIATIGAEASPCGGAWGHMGLGLGHTTIALSSESGDRQAVVLATMHPLNEETWNAMGRLAWACLCG